MDIKTWMYNIGTGLAQRSGANGWTSPQAIAILYRIALTGEFVATDAHFPLTVLTADQITAACRRLEEEDFYCYWCGVKLSFTQESGYSQYSPDRLGDMQYFEVGQRTVRSCTHCQFLFNDATTIQREEMIDDLLSDRYRPDVADKVLELYEIDANDEKAREQGIFRSNMHQNYWNNKFSSQSLKRRQAWSEGHMKTKTEDIRDWNKEQCCEFGRMLDNRCLVTGFQITDVNESISIDRIWDDGHYTEQDCMLLWWPLNRSKAKVPFFKTKAAFLYYKADLGLEMSDRKGAVSVIREALEKLREFQRAKRHSKSENRKLI